MSKFLKFLIFFQLLTKTSYAKDYSTIDLEILARQNAHEEYLTHYLDIRPSERNKIWIENTQNMGTLWLKTLIKNNLFSESVLDLAIKRSREIPFKDDELFRFTLDDYFSKYLEQNSKQELGQFQNTLKKILSSKPTNSDWAFKILQLYSSKISNQETRNLVQIILNAKDFSIFCQKQEFTQILIRLFIEDQSLQRQKSDFMTSNLTKGCKSKISTHFHSIVLQSKKINSLDDFLFFKEISSIEKHQEKLFFLKLILNVGEKSETLNLAWNYVLSLKENFKEREFLLNEIKKYDPLWGEALFKNIKSDRNQSFFTLIDQNFPEYTDHYARTCLNYLTAKETGTVIHSCHEFFRNPKLRPLWSDQYIELKRKVEKTK